MKFKIGEAVIDTLTGKKGIIQGTSVSQGYLLPRKTVKEGLQYVHCTDANVYVISMSKTKWIERLEEDLINT